MIGQMIAHYRVLEKLGQGGMGVVYLAEDTRLGRRVALKALAPEFARDPQRRKRFHQEARAAASISHPGIAAVYALEEVGDDLYIVFEYVRGESLRTLVTRGGMELDTLLGVALDIAQAMAAAHDHGVVHRDLKPENILRTSGGQTKILDFGLARFQTGALDQETRSVGLTQAGSILGTVAYMSPEQLEGKEADFRSDVFSFGVLLYELATGAHPFEGASVASTITRIMTAEPAPLVQRNPLAPAELDRIARKCLRKRPEERYQSTRDLAVDLDTLRRETSAPARPAAVESAAVAPAAPEPREPSLLGAMFSSVGASPRRWWELHQLLVVFVYAPLATFLFWKNGDTMLQVMRTESPGPALKIIERSGLGFLIFFILLVMATVSIRVYLVCLAAFVPTRLGTEVRRFQPALKVVYFMVAGLLGLAVIPLMHAAPEHGGILAAAMAVLCLVTVIVAMMYEPTIVRAAFPEAFVKRESALLPKYRYIAGIHLIFLLLLVLPVATRPKNLQLIFADEFSVSQLGSLAYGFVLLVGGTALLVNAVESWRENFGILRHFHRFFPAYACLDLIGIGAWVSAGVPIPVAIAVLLVLLYLPYTQLQLAKEILAASGEHVPERPTAREVPREFRIIAAIQAIYFLPIVWVAAQFAIQGMKDVEEAVFSAMGHAPPVKFLAITVLPVIFLGTFMLLAITTWRIWQGDNPSVRFFLRWFPAVLFFDLCVLPFGMVIFLKNVGLFAAWLALPVLAYLPFHQRHLARRILESTGRQGAAEAENFRKQ